MNYRLDEIFFGMSDGKKEALIRPNFQDYYYEYENIVQKALIPSNFLVLGKKGTGKSLLGEYLVKITQPTEGVSDIISFKEFRFHKIRELKSEDVAPNEYIVIWTWIILIEFAKLTLKNKYLEGDRVFKRLKQFIENGYNSLLLTSLSDNDERLLANVNGKYFCDLQEKEETGKYYNFIDDLERCIEKLLIINPKYRYLLILDELDDRFVNDEVYKNGIISLIKAAERLNSRFARKSFNSKILILLRTDIFVLINDTDLNKIKRDSSISIDWGRITKFDSPLFDIVVKKIRVSIPTLANSTRDQVIKQFFPEHSIKSYINQEHISTARYLLERTFFRPRDLITYLNIIKNNQPDAQFFSAKSIQLAEKEYSEYLLDEIRNEIKGHADDNSIDEIFKLLKHLTMFYFSFDEIKAFEEQKRYLHTIGLKDALDLLFKFSIIGNTWTHYLSGKRYYSHKARDERAEIDFDKTFVLHLGLRKAFQL